MFSSNISSWGYQSKKQPLISVTSPRKFEAHYAPAGCVRGVFDQLSLSRLGPRQLPHTAAAAAAAASEPAAAAQARNMLR